MTPGIQAMGNTQARASSHHHHHHPRCPAPPPAPSALTVETVSEAHDLLSEMLIDPELPPHILSGLKTLSTLLGPNAMPPDTSPSQRRQQSRSHHKMFSSSSRRSSNGSLQQQGAASSSSPQQTPTNGRKQGKQQGVPKRRRSSLILPYFRCVSDNEEIPFTGERPSALPKRLRKNLPPSLLRRKSMASWTTTTSATGLPILESEPLRKRSTSFKNLDGQNSDGDSSTSSPASAGATTVTTATSPLKTEEVVVVPTKPQPVVPPRHLSPGLESLLNAIPEAGRPHPPRGGKGARSFSTTAIPSGKPQRRNSRERKTVCSLHPLTPHDVQCLSELHESAKSKDHDKDEEDDKSDHRLSADVDAGEGQRQGIEEELEAIQERRNHHHENIEEEEEEDEDEEDDDDEEDELELPPLPSFRRLNAAITSDYESSNDSPPSGSDSTTDDVGGHRVLRLKTRHVGVQTGTQTVQKEPCALCGLITPAEPEVFEENAENNEGNDEREIPRTRDILASDGGSVTVEDVVYDLDQLAQDHLLGLIDIWDFPIFDMEQHAGQMILSQMCYRIFLETGLFDSFRIPLLPFLSYFHALERGYRDKPYHNRMHASDVLHGVYFLISQPVPGFLQVPPNSTDSPLHRNATGRSNCCKISSGVGKSTRTHERWPSVSEDEGDAKRPAKDEADDEDEDDEEETYGMVGANYPALEIMALYAAAAMHDYDHPGRTNAFLVSTFSPQAILYNDRSVLENHHAAAAWSLFLSTPTFNWLRGLDKAEFKRFRYLVIECILATDLKRHFDILAEFNAKVNEEDSPGLDWSLEADRLLVMQMAIKLADINGPCKCRDIHIQWTHRIAHEFYEQGDDEIKRGLPISPFMDRTKPQLAKLQESFISHLVAPLVRTYGEGALLPGVWMDDEEVVQDDEESQLRDSEEEQNNTDAQSTTNKTSDDADVSGVHHKKGTKLQARKIFCQQTKNLQDNYEYWIAILKKETEKEGQIEDSENSAEEAGENFEQESQEQIKK